MTFVVKCVKFNMYGCHNYVVN